MSSRGRSRPNIAPCDLLFYLVAVQRLFVGQTENYQLGVSQDGFGHNYIPVLYYSSTGIESDSEGSCQGEKMIIYIDSQYSPMLS